MLLALALLVTPARALVAVPALTAHVVDLTRTLDAATVARLEQRLSGLEQAKGSQLAVLVAPTTQPESIEQYGLRVAEAWKLGRKGVDDGAILLLAKEDRRLRIEVGYGLEGVIPDAVAKRVIDEVITPRLRAGDFNGGVLAGAEALIRLVEGEPLPSPVRAEALPDWLNGAGEHAPLVMAFIFVIGGVLRAIFGRLLGASVAASVAFFGAWLLFGAFIVAVGIGLVSFLMVLVGGSRRGVGRHGGGFGGGLGGGGFTGGGGGFGGGGASGRW